MSPNDLWGELPVSGDESVTRMIGELTVHSRCQDGERQIAWEYSTTTEPEWTRFITQPRDSVHLIPALPDRPVVLRPQTPVVILPGQEGHFFFSVPVWARFVSELDGRRLTMAEIGTRQLSSTWFGDMMTGELCYALDSRLLPLMPENDADEAFARCEVTVRNGSRDKLQFERICVHVEHLHLYGAEGRLWSNPMNVVFKGAEQVSQLSILPGPPRGLEQSTIVCEPREVLGKNLFKRSFNMIREITGI